MQEKKILLTRAIIQIDTTLNLILLGQSIVSFVGIYTLSFLAVYALVVMLHSDLKMKVCFALTCFFPKVVNK